MVEASSYARNSTPEMVSRPAARDKKSEATTWSADLKEKPYRFLGQAARDPIDGFDMAYFGDPRYIGWGGGVPVRVDGAVVGAVSASSLPEEEDMELAAIGVAAILNSR